MRERRARALSSASSGRLRKGMLRHLLLVLDMSAAAAATDMRPSRLRVMLGAARALVRRFVELNPLGQLGVGVLRDGVALKLTDLSGSPEAQVARIQALQSATGAEPVGEAQEWVERAARWCVGLSRQECRCCLVLLPESARDI